MRPFDAKIRWKLDQKTDAVKLRISRGHLEKLLESVKPVPKETGVPLPPPPTEFPLVKPK
ncbi:MAG: hypothetical protein K8T89_02255 [Planctomycetes bacterium]|nr:hypothetical protein [Planctomycetota bacterium]